MTLLQQGKREQVLTHLRNQEGDANEKDPIYHWGMLHIAAREGDEELAQALLAAGAGTEGRDGMGQTPLHRAAFSGHLPLLLLLLRASADFTALDDLLQTPADLARQKCHTVIVEELDRRTDLLLRQGEKGREGEGEGEGERVRARRMLVQVALKREEEVRRERRSRALQRAARDEARIWRRSRREGELQESLDALCLELKEVRETIARMDVGTDGLKGMLERERRLEKKRGEVAGKLARKREKVLKEIEVSLKGEAWIHFINS